MIRDAIKKAVDGQDLSEHEMKSSMNEIMDGEATDAQIASLITALRMKGETVEEITGAASVMREKALSVPVADREDLVDIVGTGGDLSCSFNISTASSFVASGAGVRVAKHGNRSVSSRCGSADVFEQLGIKIDLIPKDIGRCIDEVGIGFLFAQKLHLAMKYAANARRETGIRTIFNMLGPLTNPADAPVQLIGVYAPHLTEIIAHVVRKLGKKRALVVCGEDGLDEITMGGGTHASELIDGAVTSYMIHPADYGFEESLIKNIRGADPPENAEIIIRILQGEAGVHRDIVCMNAASAIGMALNITDIQESVARAQESIDSGKALNKLHDLRAATTKMSGK